MVAEDEFVVPVTIILTVFIDPADEQLWDTIRRAPSLLSFNDVVRSEIASNLESVSYVRHVSIMKQKGGEV